jgi:hypothetical protein
MMGDGSFGIFLGFSPIGLEKRIQGFEGSRIQGFVL